MPQKATIPKSSKYRCSGSLDAFSQRSHRCRGIRGALNDCCCCNSTGVVASTSNNNIRRVPLSASNIRWFFEQCTFSSTSTHLSCCLYIRLRHLPSFISCHHEFTNKSAMDCQQYCAMLVYTYVRAKLCPAKSQRSSLFVFGRRGNFLIPASKDLFFVPRKRIWLLR